MRPDDQRSADNRQTASDGDRGWRLGLFGVAAVVLAAGAAWGLPSGKSIVGGLTILDGGVPYRDFWTMYAPGQFYAVALVYGLFGAEVLVQAIAVSLVRAGSAVAFFSLLRRLGATPRLALALSAVFVAMFWETAPELSDYPPALLFLLLALDRHVRYLQHGAPAHLRWAGVWLGLAACFKHDVAAYVALGAAASLFGVWYLSGAERPPGWMSPLRATWTLAAPAVATVAPLALWTAWTAGPDAWQDLFVFPLTTFAQVRGDPFPPIVPEGWRVLRWLTDVTNAVYARTALGPLATWIILRTPPIVFAVGLATALPARRTLGPERTGAVLLFTACMPLPWTAAHVQQNTHPYTLAILGAAIGVTLWSARRSQPGFPPPGLPWPPPRLARVLGGAALCVYAGGLVHGAVERAALVAYEWPGSRVLDVPGARGIRVPGRLYDVYQPVARFFRTHTGPDEPIFTGLARHDSIVINNTMLYALAGRPACCGYTELHPGVADRAPVQREIIRRLETHDVRAIALWEFGTSERLFEIRKQRTMSAIPDAGSTLLDEHIDTHFRTVSTHGEYQVLWRRDLPAPDLTTDD